MKFDHLHPADQICQIMKRIYDRKETTVSGGNLSIRDEEGHIWISPSGGDKGNLQRDDVLEVLQDGTVIGTKPASLETPIHQAVLAARPDFKAVLHAHSPAAVALSIVHETPQSMMYPQLANMAGSSKVALYGAPGSDVLAVNVAEVFQKGCDVAILENHGLFIGSTQGMRHAFEIFDAIDFGIRTQLNTPVLCGHGPSLLEKGQLEMYNLKVHLPHAETFCPEGVGKEEQLQREMMAMLCKRAYDKEIFSATGGVISARVDEKSFLITPQGLDHAYADPDDMVMIKNGKWEEGKIPHFYVNLFQEIYEKKPGIGGLMAATPPYAMCYAVSETDYDITLIPESYSMLMSTKRFPFGSTITASDKIAEYLAVDHPVAIIENECFMIAGTTVFQSFDCFEIAEYGAKSVNLTIRGQKKIINITEGQMEELSARVKVRQKELADAEKRKIENKIHSKVHSK